MHVPNVAGQATPKKKKKLYADLTFQVLVAIVIGIVVGHLWPEFGTEMKPLGDIFIKLVKMVVGPVIFLTVVTGIASVGDMKKVGRVGIKALIYFEVVTTFALGIGLVLVNLMGPGRGMNVVVSGINNAEVAKYAGAAAKGQSTADVLLHIVPDNLIGAFGSGDLLQILFFSILFGAALSLLGERGKPVEDFLERLSYTFFGVINIVMYYAPVGAFGAIAFTIGKFGIGSLTSLGELLLGVLITMVLFITVVLGSISRIYGFSIFRFLAYFKDELMIVLGTSSSETVLPRMMDKLQRLGCAKPVVGLVIPTGYSFNLDGTSIYLSMAAIFIAQAYNVHLSIWQQLSILALLMVTSKGAAAVTGGGFITLAATMSATGVLPIEGLALLLGVDRFMSTGRALTNMVGNGVATMVIAKMEKEFDETKALHEYQVYFERPAMEAM
ncbi:dicarboxylate/amino acid:cation symporter [Telmatospirillum siberiense]|uniref:Glutamate/aspartate:proton symporter GltP n=1 Tax=Telmatospirillum siberiense TaxID=382514 RepID=A0A2N3PME7_9PROT|nr:dicarboxylate/amino acid:cation symporter [Telmatospirillum siberiense]PKU21576.1 glutamate/aspartate:proton symporter GltP [Telmatospirillum siberiense]